MAIFDGPGRGRRQCPSCSIYIGVQSKTCDGCGAVLKGGQVQEKGVEKTTSSPTPKPFLPTKSPSPPKIQHQEPKPAFSGSTLRQIYTPAGECPVPLRVTDVESVSRWAEQVREHFAQKDSFLTLNGLTYFARIVFEFDSLECKTVIKHLHELYPEEKGERDDSSRVGE